MSENYVCWLPDDEDEPGQDASECRRVVEPGDAEAAAEHYAERRHADCDYPEEMLVMVRDSAGRTCAVTVLVEMVPTFRGTTTP